MIEQRNRSSRSLVLRLAAGAALTLGFALSAHAVSASQLSPNVTLQVNETADNPADTCASACSLRGAITTANAEPASTITRILVPAGHYVLTNGELYIDPTNSGNITQITGAGSASTIIDASGSPGSSVFDTYNGFVQLTGMTITGGSSSSGAGIYEDSGLTLTSVVITGNNAGTSGYGGGIYMDGYDSVTLSTVSITRNAAYYGGGIYNNDSTVSARNLVVTNNIACDSFATAAGPFAAHNPCLGYGEAGGIYTDEYMSVDIGTISNNHAGELAGDTGEGGGIENDYLLHLTSVTITGNSAGEYGGGIYNSDYASFSGGSVSNNVAGEYGGGVYNSDYLWSTGTAYNNNQAGGTFYCTPSSTPTSCPGSTGPTAGPCPASYYACSSYSGYGGGIYNNDYGFVYGGTINSNNAVTTLYSDGTVNEQGEGGGVYVDDPFLMRSVIMEFNQAYDGGGLYIYEPTTLQNDTILFNKARDDGGAAYVNSSYQYLAADSSTIVGNSAVVQTGGIWNSSFGDFATSGSTVLAGNLAPGACRNSTLPCT